MIRSLVLAFFLAIGLSSPGFAASDIEKAVDAYWRGDYETALEGFLKLAPEKHSVAHAYLAVMYQLGQGVSPNPSIAADWRERTGRFRPHAYRRLLDYVMRAQGLSRRHGSARTGADDQAHRARANRLRAQAALADMPDTDLERGHRYYLGLGVPQDYVEAAKWYYRAAKKGVGAAQGYLGIMTAWGHGVPDDGIESYKWLDLGAKNAKDAEERDVFRIVRDQLATLMTTEDVKTAARKAKDFKPEPN